MFSERHPWFTLSAPTVDDRTIRHGGVAEDRTLSYFTLSGYCRVLEYYLLKMVIKAHLELGKISTAKKGGALASVVRAKFYVA